MGIEILSVAIDHNIDFSQAPIVRIEVSRMPEFYAYRNSGTVYFAETPEGFCEFFVWSGTKNDGGYGGRCWDVAVIDASGLPRETRRVKGPFSGRSSICEQAGFAPSMPVHLIGKRNHLGGPLNVAGNIRIEALDELLKQFGLTEWVTRGYFVGNRKDEPSWQVHPVDGCIDKQGRANYICPICGHEQFREDRVRSFVLR